MKLSTLSIGSRLGLGFGFILLLLALLSLASLSRMASMQSDLQKIVHDNNLKIRALNSMRQAVMIAAVATRNMSVMTNDEDISTEVRHIEEATKSYRTSADQLTRLAQSADAAKRLADIEAAEKKSAPLVAKAVNLARKQADVMPVLLNEVSPSQQAWLAAIEELIAYQERQAQQTAQEASSGYQPARSLVIFVTAAALLLGSTIAWIVTRSITTPLRRAVTVAQRVSGGDLSEEIPVLSRDETGQLMAALREMNEGLERIVLKVRYSTDAMLAAAGEIASGNLDLSNRTEEQANALTVTARSMDRLTAAVRHNAESAQQARSLAHQASDIATQGGNAVAQVVRTMASIQASAKRIADIIGVIDGIAFQTNILALNAAVEASRAGEQGRGFAVVAAEVRALAHRSAEAAREIKTLIGESTKQVGTGTESADRAGQTMESVVASIRNVTDMIGAIAAASTEQTAGIEQVRAAIADMDDVTHRNAALVEEAAAAAGSMKEEAEHLSEAVCVFKLHQTHSAS